MKKEAAKLSRLLFLMIVLAFTTTFLSAQVAINTDGTDPNGSAMLDVKSSDKGLLIPRLTTTQRTTLAATAVAGLMVYDTNLDKFFFFNGAIWEEGSAGNLWTESGSYIILTDTSNYVGIGTTTPARQLDVNGGSSAIPARLSSTSSGARLEFLSTATTDWAVGTWGSSIRFLSSTNEFGSVSDQYYMDINEFRPWSNNSKTLGSSSVRWSNLYSVAGNFSGNLDVTGNTAITGTTTILGATSIGTTSPMGQLHVHDVGSYPIIYLTPSEVNDSSALFLGEDPDGTYGMYWKYNGGINEMELWGKANSNHYGPHLRVTRNTGNIAIGGDFAVGYKLSVTGDIICEELRVNLIADWPDYVFEREYDLMSIPDLSKYVDKNGHLPNVPPAEEIEKSGIAVGEMQRLMMEKIEELSLYIIEQQQQIDELKAQVNK